MKVVPVYIVDAFTTKRFAGNAAAVCLLDKQDIPEEAYLKIAAEFNLSQTAYPRPLINGDDIRTASDFSLRWFSPTVEMDLCGHATLAAAHVLFEEIENENTILNFHTLSGILTVKKSAEGGIEMNFPAHPLLSVHIPGGENAFAEHFPEIDSPPFLKDLIQAVIPETLAIRGVVYSKDIKKLVIVVDENTPTADFHSFKPNYSRMLEIHPEGSFLTAVNVALAPKNPSAQGYIDESGRAYDYVSRNFPPWLGITEDPATGSAQVYIAPFYSKVLGKKQLYAFQDFPNRGAQFSVTILEGEEEGRLAIVGSAVTVVRGALNHPQIRGMRTPSE